MQKTKLAVLTAALMIPAAAYASPNDELNEIMEKQAAMASESLLEQTIGFSEINKKIEENGMEFQWRGGLTEEGQEAFGEMAGVPAGGYVELDGAVNTKQKAWKIAGGAGSDEGSILDFALTGSTDQLSLQIPQLMDGALTISGGSWKEQLLQSVLAELFELTEDNEILAAIPDFNLTFYPEGDLFTSGEIQNNALTEALEEKINAFGESIQFEKVLTENATVYHAEVPTSDVIDIYEMIFDQYGSLMEQAEALGTVDISAEDLDVQLDQMLYIMENVIGEEVGVYVYVKDDLVTRMEYQMYLDTTALENMDEVAYTSDELVDEEVEGELAPAGKVGGMKAAVGAKASGAAASEEVIGGADEATEIEVTGEPFQGELYYGMEFVDPADISRGMNLFMNLSDLDASEMVSLSASFEAELNEAGTEETYTLYVNLEENGESLYSDVPVVITYNAETNELYGSLYLGSEEDSPSVFFDSSFSDVEKGKSFRWTMDELSLIVDGEKAGVASELYVNAEPQEIALPENSMNLFKMTADELVNVITEISTKAQEWSAQFAETVEMVEEETDGTV